MLHLIWSIIIGCIVGWLAGRFYGAPHLGFLLTTLLGVGGSIVGGLIGSLFKRSANGAAFHPAGFIMSIIGAIVILFIAKQLGYM
jgi:uncharacterized membrane protein YeaQ/YmgE (transglycosylase-associated protein family)